MVRHKKWRQRRRNPIRQIPRDTIRETLNRLPKKPGKSFQPASPSCVISWTAHRRRRFPITFCLGPTFLARILPHCLVRLRSTGLYLALRFLRGPRQPRRSPYRHPRLWRILTLHRRNGVPWSVQAKLRCNSSGSDKRKNAVVDMKLLLLLLLLFLFRVPSGTRPMRLSMLTITTGISMPTTRSSLVCMRCPGQPVFENMDDLTWTFDVLEWLVPDTLQ